MGQLGLARTASLVDVLDRVLDKGIVIDAHLAVLVLGVRLIEVESVVVVASLSRYASLGPPLVRAPLVHTAAPRTTANASGAKRRVTRRPRTTRRRTVVHRCFRCEQGCTFHLAAPADADRAVARCPYALGGVCELSAV